MVFRQRQPMRRVTTVADILAAAVAGVCSGQHLLAISFIEPVKDKMRFVDRHTDFLAV
jgi:hypothetical protein